MPPKPKPWFRFYVEAVHDRKLRRLKPEHRWLFVVCLAAARQSPTPGVLLIGENDPMDWDDLIDFAHLTRRQVESGILALEDMGVVAYSDDLKAWHIPNWEKRQFESDNVTKRTAKHRSESAGGNDDGTF